MPAGYSSRSQSHWPGHCASDGSTTGHSVGDSHDAADTSVTDSEGAADQSSHNFHLDAVFIQLLSHPLSSRGLSADSRRQSYKCFHSINSVGRPARTFYGYPCRPIGWSLVTSSRLAAGRSPQSMARGPNGDGMAQRRRPTPDGNVL